MEPTIVTGLIAVLLGIGIGYVLRRTVALKKLNSLELEAEKKRSDAERASKEIIVEAKAQAAALLLEVQQDERKRKEELRSFEERLIKKDEALEKRASDMDEKTKALEKEKELLREKEKEIASHEESFRKKLESIAGLSAREAKEKLFEEIKNAYRDELLETMVKYEREKKDEVEKKSLEIITGAIQRYARTHIADITTSVVELPNEEIKGKIIGREGRNIRTFERLTGVEVIVDETPESIVLSSFDPMRRELARIALLKLIKDGRIQPAKIEEKVEEAKQELDDHVRKIGEEAAYEVGIPDLPKELIFLLGRLHFRTSYGQNVLTHSIEMAHIAGTIASELNCKVEVAKKAALLHDIGKAIDHEVDGTHVELGRKILKKYGVHEDIIRGMEAHHEEYPFSTPESFVVATADIISAARPGARRDTVEKYLKRLEDIERTVNSFTGVKQSYAISAGREVRVFVVPEKIDDFGAFDLAKQIANKIQENVQYPGEIKVTVIREVKAVEYAK